MADTGNAATFVLSGFTGTIQAMSSLPEWAVEMLDASHLGSTNFMELIPGDLLTPGEIEMNLIFDSTVATPTLPLAGTGTITLPIGTSGNTTNATLAGTGVLRLFQFPPMANSTVQVGRAVFAYDGLTTEPTYTVESA